MTPVSYSYTDADIEAALRGWLTQHIADVGAYEARSTIRTLTRRGREIACDRASMWMQSPEFSGLPLLMRLSWVLTIESSLQIQRGDESALVLHLRVDMDGVPHVACHGVAAVCARGRVIDTARDLPAVVARLSAIRSSGTEGEP